MTQEEMEKQYIFIQRESTVHLCLRLRGGMYDITSGRRDLEKLTQDIKSGETSVELLTEQLNKIKNFVENFHGSKEEKAEIEYSIAKISILLNQLANQSND